MSLYPRNFNEYIASMGIPRGPNSQVFLVDPDNGDDDNTGTNILRPLETVAAAYAKCVTDQHDVVLMISNDSSDTLAAAIDWSKDFTHLVGMSSNLHGVGQRCRIVGGATTDLTYLVDFQGKGCIVRNIQFANFADANVDSGAVIVSGDRNEFYNVFIAGMGHATPGARAGSYSLKLSGEENQFSRCAIGLDTIVRAAANKELWVTTGATRNSFTGCRIYSYSETAGKFLVLVDGGDRYLEFEDCVFHNFSVNHANTLTNAFSDTNASTHDIIFRGKNQLIGIDGWGDTVTSMWFADSVPNAGAGVAINPTT
jgi:hypothetical protein